MALVGKKQYDAMLDVLPAGMVFFAYPVDPTTHWTILGDQSQILHVSLAPNEFVISERGSLCYMNDGIKREIQVLGGIFGNVGTMVGGESIFKWKYSNITGQKSFVGVCSPTPGNMVPIDMTRNPEGIWAKRQSWVASIGRDVQISAKFSIGRGVSCLAGCFGVGPVLQTIKGGSWAFLSAYGTIVTKELAPGEQMVVDEDAFVACATTVKLDVRLAGGCYTVFAGGEGAFNLIMTGPGLVILESLSIRRLRKLFQNPDGRKKKKKGGNSSQVHAA